MLQKETKFLYAHKKTKFLYAHMWTVPTWKVVIVY